MRATTLIAATLLATGVLYAPQRLVLPCVVPGEALAAAEETPEDWEKNYERMLDNSVAELQKLAKWCEKNHLEWTANYVRRLGFHYRPDDPELRSYFGYEREGPRWRQNDIRRDEFRSMIDEDDPDSSKFPKQIESLRNKVSGWFKGLAQKADKLATETGDPRWKELSAKAWEEVLATDPDGKNAKPAHEALGHPKFDGEYVSPFKLKFLEARKSRKQAGEALAAKSGYTTQQVAADGYIPGAGLTGFGNKTDHWTINTTHSQEVADRLALWAERATEDIVERYGLPDAVKQRIPVPKFDIVKQGKEELEQYLDKGAKWDRAKITRFLEYFSGMSPGPGVFVSARSSGADADDGVIHYVGHWLSIAALHMAIGDLGRMMGDERNDLEDWLQESIAYDCTRRLTGTTLTTCGAFGKYGNTVTPKPGQDLWIQLARRQVEMDDDVPVADLWRKDINDLRGPETVKGYALIQFLFEHDSALAQKFIWNAMAHGTPQAVVDVYGDWLGTAKPAPLGKDEKVTGSLFQRDEYLQAMHALDDRYKEWILKAW